MSKQMVKCKLCGIESLCEVGDDAANAVCVTCADLRSRTIGGKTLGYGRGGTRRPKRWTDSYVVKGKK